MKNFWTKLASAALALVASAGLSFAVYQSSVDGIGLGSTTAPVLTGCGTGSPTIVGNDMAGTVTTGTTATGCVVTFNSAKSAVPACVVTHQVAPATSTPAYTVTATAITVVQASQTGNKFNYVCMGL
jgi:hypothetical protein